MSNHSVAEAKSNLSRLIDAALTGEVVVITRHGHPVVEITPIRTASRRSAREALTWMDGKRAALKGPANPVEMLSRMRDDDGH